MGSIKRGTVSVVATSAVLLLIQTVSQAAPPDGDNGKKSRSPANVAAELDAQRLLGKAYYENAETPPQFKPAAEAFRRCIALAPDSAVDHVNLGLTLMRAEQYDEAIRSLNEALRLDSDLLAASYVAGIVHKRLSKAEKAAEYLELVTVRDPQCMGAFYNLGVCHKLLRDYEKAVAAFKKAVEIAPTHPSCHLQLMTLYRRLGDVENVKRHKEIFDRVKETVDESEKTAEALERSRYSYVIEVPRLTDDLAPDPDAMVKFVDITADAGLGGPPAHALEDKADADPAQRYVMSTGSAVALGDFDSDGDLDCYAVNCSAATGAKANRLYRNEGDGRFKDVTADYGVGDPGHGMDAVFGDIDNDGHKDLYVVNNGANVLYRKSGDGAYRVGGGSTAGAATTDVASAGGVCILEPSGPLPASFRIAASVQSPADRDCKDADHEKADHGHNAYIVFDYRGPDDFKFAGADMGAGFWSIGRFDGEWRHEARVEEGLSPDTIYKTRLTIDGDTASLWVGEPGNMVKKVAHDFGKPLTGGDLGLAAHKAVAKFDNITVGSTSDAKDAIEPGARVFYSEDFKDGVADGVRVVAGDWTVVDWKYENVSERARVNEPQFGRKAVFVDYDHDGDLDIYIVNDVDFASAAGTTSGQQTVAIPASCGGQVNALLRNNGNGTFSDRTDEAGLLIDCSQTRDVIATDLDDDHDVDVFAVNADAPNLLLANDRLGKFTAAGSFSPPIPVGCRAVAERDFNRDGRPDLLITARDRLLLYTNHGKNEFTGAALKLPDILAAAGVGRIGILDYNNDGWPDALLAGANGRGLCLLAGAGKNQFRDVTAAVGLDATFGDIADFAIGDLDDDGDEDLVLQTRDRGLRLLRNDLATPAHWIDVRLVGKKVNRGGRGATVEIASGGHYQKQTVDEGRTHFGIGDLSGVDVVRVMWPNGQAQNVIRPAVDGPLTIVQHVKVSASCAFLYTFNGRGFELVNEILGIGPLGAPMAPGVYFPLDNTELTKIESHQLTPVAGHYELRLTEELREIAYTDQITLRVVDHPAGLEIVPNEMFSFPPPEDKLFAFADGHPPVSAVDDRGVDVLPLVHERDGTLSATRSSAWGQDARPNGANAKRTHASLNKLKNVGSLGIAVVSATRRKFFTTDYTDYTDFLLFSVLIREICG